MDIKIKFGCVLGHGFTPSGSSAALDVARLNPRCQRSLAIEPLEARIAPAAAFFDLSGVDGTTGFRLSGGGTDDLSGVSVSDAGDVNGDGFDDVIIGAREAFSHEVRSGASYVVFGKAGGFAANLDLSALDGTNGFKLSGAAPDDRFGGAVSGAGDVNGDGFGDVIIGAYGADPNGFSSGASYVVFGKASGFAANVDVSALDGTNGFKLSGVAAGSFSGRSVSGAGDFNGDGFGDLLIGAPGVSPNGLESGATYVVFGKGSGFVANLELSVLDETSGFKINGMASRDRLGASVSAAGDVNGDGFGDLLIGASLARYYGAAYVIFGKASGSTVTLDLSELDGTNGFKLTGVDADVIGQSVSGAGDVNGDGFADLISGFLRSGPNRSVTSGGYVVFGKASGFVANFNASTLDGANGFILSGAAARTYPGNSVSSAGDVNGDGFDDVLIGTSASDPSGERLSYVVFGKGRDFARQVDLSTLDGNNGIKFGVPAADDTFGGAVSAAGDVNGDGVDDLLIGTPGADFNGAHSGASYVVFGKGPGSIPDLSINDASIIEADEATTKIVFTVSLSAISSQTVTVQYATADGTANAPGDYTAVPLSSLVFNPGEVSKTIVVAVQGDTSFELDENFLLNLSNPVNATIADGRGIGTIVNNDANLGFLGFSSLDGMNGFKLSGVARDDRSGSSVSNAGDVNGDGFDDLIIGAYRASANGLFAGASYVVFGKASGFDANLDLSSLDGRNGFRLSAGERLQYSGRPVSGAGDVNGDGFDDVIISSRQGATYVVFGKPTGFPATLDLSALDGNTGFKLIGPANNGVGGSVSGAGDFNGDGFDDLIIGAGNGSSYLVWGRASGFLTSLLSGDNAVDLHGIASDGSGGSVSGAGDINGDGFDDLIIGAFPAGPNSGSGVSYVVFGNAEGFPHNFNLALLDGTNGFQISSLAANGYSGSAVSGAGDVNGDGFDDLLIGAPHADPNGDSSGASYVIFGKARGFAGNLDLSTLDGTNGFKLSGIAAGDLSGSSVSGAGDINADGFGDLLIGAQSSNRTGWPFATSYLIFGKANGFAANVELSTLDGSNGFALGVARAQDGRLASSVSGAGDVNGDGFDDLLIGAAAVDSNGQHYSGASYVVFGRVFGGPLPEVSVDDASVTEPDVGTAMATFTVRLSAPSSRLITVQFATSDHEAHASEDYTALGLTTLAFEPGEVSKTVAVTVRGDTFYEPDETFSIDLSNPTNATLADGRGVGTILNDDANPAVFDLSSLDGLNGFKLHGVAKGDLSGRAVSNAGDVNGDGFGDVLIGAEGADPNGARSGTAYVVFGRANGFDADFELSSLDGTNGFKLSGVAQGDGAGTSVSAAGDVNGDGFGDLLIGAYAADPNGSLSGVSYVVFGKANGFAASIELSALDGANGFRLTGVSKGDESGWSVSGAGDINGDGLDDLLIGTPWVNSNSPNSGACYVVFGKASGFAADFNLAALDGANGFRLSGVSNDLSGISVSAAGDVNRDGFDDIIIGSWGSGAYVFFGKATGFTADFILSALNGANGFKITGNVFAREGAGSAVSKAGDVNGDGFDDLLIAAYHADANDVRSGASYVVFGHATGFSRNLSLSSLDGTNGFKLSDVESSYSSGGSVSAAGDVNGDGFDDLLIGPNPAMPGRSSSGLRYVVFGKAGGFDANITLSTLAGTNGFKISGAAVTNSSTGSQSGAGDVNGDGFDDVLIGGPAADPHGAGSGTSYVIFGGPLLSINDVNITETNSGAATASFKVSLSLPSTRPITVEYSTGNGTADSSDYTSLAPTTLTFNPGEVTKTIDVSVNGDAMFEPDESFYLNLSNPGGATITDAIGRGTITNDDAPPSISIDDISVAEGATGSANAAIFTVSLSNPSSDVVTVQFATADGTAVAPADYQALPLSTMTFAPGEVSHTISVPILGDFALEPDKLFSVVLSNPINASLADAYGQGKILNDDFPVIVSANGHKATFGDVDGDDVIIKSSKGGFIVENFIFAPDGTLSLLDLTASTGLAGFAKTTLSISAKTPPGGSGDGLVSVGAIHAFGVSLKSVKVDGALGEIDVGEGVAGKAAFASLTADSLGNDGGPLVESLIAGTVGLLKIKHDVKGVLHVTGGAPDNVMTNVAGNVINKVVIGGNLDGGGGGATAGRIEAAGGIGSMVVKGSVIGGAGLSGIVVGGSIGSLKIEGDLTSAEAANPVTISALGTIGASNTTQAMALTTLSVGGNVLNAQILAGYRRDLTPLNPDANIGSIKIAGAWRASSIVAGVADSTGDGFGVNDVLIPGDTTPELLSRIASITIAGAATGNASAGDHFGIIAQQIGRLIAGGNSLRFTTHPDDFLIDSLNNNFRAIDFA